MPSNRSGENRSVETVLDSTLDSVDTAEQIVLRAATDVGFGEDELHKIGVAIREAMVNAVVHGNRYSAHKKVRLAVSEAPDRLTIRIQDEGEGFDVASLPDPLAAENLLRQSGRGILLIRAFVDEFHVRHLESGGTELSLVLYRTRSS
ncbi:MAG TPA: ATP-binding protein [Bryobacteraceae bacterium]|nr:ATP-binding protein [Bryobacteraceae bacterium]